MSTKIVVVVSLLSWAAAWGQETPPDAIFYVNHFSLPPGPEPLDCGQAFTFEVFMSYQRDCLQQVIFGMRAVLDDGASVPMDLIFRADPSWEGSNPGRTYGGEGELIQGVAVLSDAFGPSDNRPLGTVTLHILEPYEGGVQVMFTNPVRTPSQMGPPTVTFCGSAFLNLEFLPSDSYRIACPQFIRGETNHDEKVDISDALNILGFLFGGTSKIACLDAADTDDNRAVDISDAIYLLEYLFLGGPPMPTPYPSRGVDATADFLDCPIGAG